MNNQQPVYLLAGGRGREIVSTFRLFRTIAETTNKTKPTVGYVGVAGMADNLLVYLLFSTLIRLISHCKIRRTLLAPKRANLDKAKKILESVDIVFFSGGDVEAGIEILKKKQLVQYFKELHNKGKLLVGVSAGSIMLANEWLGWEDPDDEETTARLFPCLGIAPVICDTHAEEFDWEELKTAIELKNKAGIVGYGITSGTCLKVYPDGKLEAVNGPIARFALNKGKIVRQTDLLPPAAN